MDEINVERIISEKIRENLVLKQELDKLEKECDRYFIIEENIENYSNNKIKLLYCKIKTIEKFLIEIATMNAILINKKNINNIVDSGIGNKILDSKAFPIDNERILVLINGPYDSISTKVDLIGLFNRIAKIKELIKIDSSQNNLLLLKKFNNYLYIQKESFKNLEFLLDNNLIVYNENIKEKYYKLCLFILEDCISDILEFSFMFMEDIHLDILIGNKFNLMEEKEKIYNLNSNYITCLSKSNTKQDIDLFKKTYEKDLSKIKRKKL